MSCRRAQGRLSAYLDSELPEPERASVAAHLAACPDCRAEAAALGRAGRALEMLGAVEVAPDLGSDLHRRLSVPPARRSRPTWVGGAIAAGAVGAACLAWLALQPPASQPAASRTDIASSRVIPGQRERAPSLTEEASQAAAIDEPYEEPTRMVGEAGKARPSPGASHTQRRPTRAEEAPESELAEAVETPPAEQEPPTPVGPAPDQARLPQSGVILLLGDPQPLPPSSYCYLEVSFPDGTKNILDQSVERDSNGEPRAVHIAYEQIGAEADPPNQGG